MTDQPQINRRTFLGETMAATALSGLRVNSELQGAGTQKKYQLFWGDLHNHNAVGYAKGSLERSIDLAQEHLDFFAFTGHASWHSMLHCNQDASTGWTRNSWLVSMTTLDRRS